MESMIGSANVVQTDVLVVGGGIAACLAAIEAKREGIDVVLVDKANVGRSGDSPVMSGILTIFDPNEDDYDTCLGHCFETGKYLNEQDILGQVIEETTRVFRELQNWGVEFVRKNGRIERYKSMGGAMNVKMVNGGIQLMDVVRGEAIRRGVRIVQRVMLVELLTSDGELPTQGRVVGALGFGIRDGRLHIFKAKAVILATGSVALQRHKCQSPFVLSADGLMAAFKVGCQLKNLELTLASFSPSDFNIGPGAHLILGQGGYLLNRNNERFMEKYDSVHMEKAARNVTGVAIAREYFEGRGPVYLDSRHLDAKAHEAIRRGVPIYIRTLEKAGLDLAKDLIQYKNGVSPCMGAGGIRINIKRATTVEGLYAAGSCADHAEDGADNVFGVGMESAVAGKIAGESAAQYISEAEEPIINESQLSILANEILEPVKRREGITFHNINEDLSRIWESIKVIRSEKALKEAIDKINEIKEEKILKIWAADHHGLAGVRGATNKVFFLELLCKCALMRTESRGGHFRIDYPQEDNKNWLKWVMCQHTGEGLKIWNEAVPFEKYPLRPPTKEG